MDYRTTIQAAYDRLAPSLREQYSKLHTPDVLPEISSRMPRKKMLDVGCGTGYNARWFAEQGYDVRACDLSEGMLSEARTHYSHERVTYYADQLPELAATRARGEKFDLIVLSAVWMHIDPSRRAQALESLMSVAAPGATMLVSLRHGAAPADRPMFETSIEEMQHLAALNLSRCEALPTNVDQLGRSNVWWDTVYLNVPKSHEDQLKLVKQVALQAAMSSPHKPVLLHCLTQAHNEISVRDAYSSTVPMEAVLPHWLAVYRGSPLQMFAQAASREKALDRIRKGPVAHMRDPLTQQPLFSLERAADGTAQLTLPRPLAESIQAHHSLMSAGAVAAVDKHLASQRRVEPAQRTAFLNRLAAA